MATAEMYRKHGISRATFRAWRAEHGRLDVSRARKLKVIEENARLKGLLAEAILEVAVRAGTWPQERGNALGAPQSGGAHTRATFELSERRACAIWPSSDAGSGQAPTETLLASEGPVPNHEKLRRVYAENRFPVRQRGG